jgi:D-sedoheptulose 7-phosphate isomerase
MISMRHYFDEVSALLSHVDEDRVAEILELFWSCYERGGRLVICGNGGSAATASHFATDLQKGLSFGIVGARPWEVLSLGESVPLLTAWSNDTEYANVFAAQARCWLRPGDLLLAISGSGNSPNVVNAVAAAAERGATSIAWAGFGGGNLADAADFSIVLHSREMQQIEDVHMILAHGFFCLLRNRLVATHRSGSREIPALSVLVNRN